MSPCTLGFTNTKCLLYDLRAAPYHFNAGPLALYLALAYKPAGRVDVAFYVTERNSVLHIDMALPGSDNATNLVRRTEPGGRWLIDGTRYHEKVTLLDALHKDLPRLQLQVYTRKRAAAVTTLKAVLQARRWVYDGIPAWEDWHWLMKLKKNEKTEEEAQDWKDATKRTIYLDLCNGCALALVYPSTAGSPPTVRLEVVTRAIAGTTGHQGSSQQGQACTQPQVPGMYVQACTQPQVPGMYVQASAQHQVLVDNKSRACWLLDLHMPGSVTSYTHAFTNNRREAHWYDVRRKLVVADVRLDVAAEYIQLVSDALEPAGSGVATLGSILNLWWQAPIAVAPVVVAPAVASAA